MNLATALVTDFYLAQQACDNAARYLYAETSMGPLPTPAINRMTDELFELDEQYALAHNALMRALSDMLTPENAMLHTVALVWAKQSYEANDYFNE